MAGFTEEEKSWSHTFFHDDVLSLLDVHVPLAQRTKALKELSEVVHTQRLEQHAVEALWLTIKDLLEETKPAEVRQLALEFITALVSGQYSWLGVLKSHFFAVIEHHNIAEDACQRLELLKALTENGKKVDYIEEIIGPFLLKWMPEVHMTKKVSEYVSLLINMVHYNAAYLDDVIVSGLVMYVCDIAKHPDSLGNMELYLDLLNAIVCYSSLPVDALVPFVTTLCHTLNVERFCEKSWQIMKKFLGTHLGHSGICTMCSLLTNRSNEPHPMLLRGAVFYIAMSLWGPFKVKSLKHSFGSVLPSLRQATLSGHIIVVYEVSLSIARLVRKYGRNVSLIEWDHVIGILMIIFEYIEQIKREKSSSSKNLMDSFSDAVSTIEGYHSTKEFNGSPDVFFALVEKCLLYRPLTSALALLSFKAESLHSTDWPVKLNAFLKQFYWTKRHTEVRLKALEVLSSLVDNYRLLHEDLLMSKVVLPTFASLASDQDIEVRSRAVQVLVSLAQECTPEWCLRLIHIISEVAQLCHSSDLNIKKANEDNLQDSKVACFGLLEIFKLKLFRTPAHIAVSCYDALVHHLQQQYINNCTSKTSCIIRLAVFNTLLNLRVNSDEHVGLLEDHEMRYSPFVRRNGQQNKMAGCSLDYCKIMAIVLLCLKEETEWDVLSLVIHSLDKVLQCRRLVSCCVDRMNDLCSALCYMVSSQQEWLQHVKNIPSSVARSDLSALIYPVLKVLCTFPEPLNRSSQYKLVQSFEHGVVGSSAHLCVTGLAICSLELQLTMSRVLPAILLKMGQISATPTMAIPVLQFLSNVVAVPVLYTGFVEQQYLSVFAIVFPYTDARKYSSYVVALAYHVITIWFIRTRIHYRRSLARFIIKHLSEEYAYTCQREDGDGQSQKVSPGVAIRSSRLSPSELQREMVEVCLDMLARYSFGSVSSQITRSPDIDKLLSGGQSKTWILTNALVTITTSGGSHLAEEDAKCGYHGVPMSCTQCGWAEVLIRRPTGNISWLMRLQNQTVGTHVLNSAHANETATDMTSSLLSTPVISRTNSQSNEVQVVADVDTTADVFSDNVDSCYDQQLFPIEVDDHNATVVELRPPESATKAAAATPVRKFELQEHRTRHTSSCSLELFPPLISYEESQAKSPSLHGGGGYLTDEEQVKLVAHFAAHVSPPELSHQGLPSMAADGNICKNNVSNSDDSASGDEELVILTTEYIPKSHTALTGDTNPINEAVLTKKQSVASLESASATMDTMAVPSNPDVIPSVARQQQRSLFPQGIVRSDDEFCQSPSFVFLQLYHSSMLGPVSTDTPKLLPPGEVLDRSLKVLDHIPPYETHKIGIVYAAKNQSKESEILSNTFGSSRYMELLGGLGQLIRLSDCTPDLIYLGGLDRSGTDGEFAYFWQDEITQVIFHVATLMPNIESDHHYSNKKLHIGNNFVTIVYNNSGRPYQFGTIKGQFNYVEVIVEPLDMGVNMVFTQCTTGLESMMYGGPYLISDQWLPVLVRQMALHANLASVVHKCSHTASSGDHYLSNWLGRLRKIARIREKGAIEDYAIKGLQDFTAYT